MKKDSFQPKGIPHAYKPTELQKFYSPNVFKSTAPPLNNPNPQAVKSQPKITVAQTTLEETIIPIIKVRGRNKGTKNKKYKARNNRKSIIGLSQPNNHLSRVGDRTVYAKYVAKYFGTDKYLVWGHDFLTADQVPFGSMILLPSSSTYCPQFNREKKDTFLAKMKNNSAEMNDISSNFVDFQGYSQFLFKPIVVSCDDSISLEKYQIDDGNQRKDLIDSVYSWDTIDGEKWIMCKFAGLLNEGKQARLYVVLGNSIRPQTTKDINRAREISEFTTNAIVDISSQKNGFYVVRNSDEYDTTKYLGISFPDAIDKVARTVHNAAKKGIVDPNLATEKRLDRIFRVMGYFKKYPSCESVFAKMFTGLDSFYDETDTNEKYNESLFLMTIRMISNDANKTAEFIQSSKTLDSMKLAITKVYNDELKEIGNEDNQI